MKPTHSIGTYLAFGLLAATGYLIIMGFFLSNHHFEAMWMLILGNLVYLLSAGSVTAYFYSRNHFQDSSVSNATAGHYVSFTGAALCTLLTLTMYFVFTGYIWKAGAQTTLADAPGGIPSGAAGGILPLILIDASFVNTVCGFFAAIVVSFAAKRNQRSEVSG